MTSRLVRVGRCWTAAALAAALWLALAAAAYGDEVLLLRYKYQAGATETYVMKGGFKGEVSGGAGGFPLAGDVEARMKIKITAVDDSGVASQEMTLERLAVTSESMGMKMQMLAEGGQLTVTVNGEPAEFPPQAGIEEMLSRPLKAKVDPRGRVLEMDVSSLGALSGGIDPSMLQQITAFPEEAVTPGASWSQQVKLPINVMGQKLDLVIAYTYTYVGTEERAGARVARINFTGSGEVRDAATFGRLSMTFSGHDLFDYGAGVSRAGKVHFEQVITGPPVGEAPVAEEGKMTMSGDFDVVLQ